MLEDKLNVKLRMTPKCHPEIAGQGIEYAWGYTKLRFCQHFNNMTAVNLDKSVCASLSSDVVTQACVNKFIRKARDYKLTYLFLLDQTKASDGSANRQQNISLHTQAKIEHIIKLFKQHRSALDSDYVFIRNV